MGGILEGWNDFFVAEAGASAALAGLLFVAVSINLSRILEYANLPARTVESLAAFVTVLFVASFALVPHQPALATGVEIAASGLALHVINLIALRADMKFSPVMRGKGARRLTRLVANQAPPLPFVIGGAMIAAGNGNGAYWLVPGTLLCFLAGLFGAWVLLIEIQR